MDKRSRVQDTAITAEALLPGGPYDLWRSGEKARRVKDLAGAFAQLPRLPKMLKASAILDTLAAGCESGTFVLKLTRPDGTTRTWWMSRPDEHALNDSALELVLPEAAELTDLPPALLAPGRLPALWSDGEITAKTVDDYFAGSKVVQVDRGGYQEPVHIPKAGPAVVEKAVNSAVESGGVWLLSGPASILGEAIPAGVLNPSAKLCAPPPIIAAAEILPENLAKAWKKGVASGLSVTTALSVKTGKTLPWKTVRDVIASALQARFLELLPDSQPWPCDLASAQFVRFKAAAGAKAGAGAPPPGAEGGTQPQVLTAAGDLASDEVQELGDVMHKLLAVSTKQNVPLRFHVRIEMGDGKNRPSEEAAKQVNALLKNVKDGLELR
jgi:hypothetical protein